MKPFDNIRSATAPRLRGALLIGALLVCSGCVVTSGGYESPYYDASSDLESYQPPPPLPQDTQPPCPGDGYLWVPGHWGYSGGYYWVPGSWELPPQVGLLWTPGYWGFSGGVYVWHAGYWGSHVGFYGGVHYGFGYDGAGYVGGRWEGHHFVYNRFVNNVDMHVIHHTYMERVEHPDFDNRVSYDGGRGGIAAYPTREDRRYEHEGHFGDTYSQRWHSQQAAQSPMPVAATPPPRFERPGVERPGGAEGVGPQAARTMGRELRPSFQDRPNFQAQDRPNFQAQGRPNFQAQGRPNFQAQGRPNFQAQGRPNFQGPSNIPARPDIQPRPQVQPQAARPMDQQRLNFPSRPNVPQPANAPARPNVEARPQDQSRPPFFGRQPNAGRPAPPVGARRGPAGHAPGQAKGRQAPGRNRRSSEQRDR